MGQFSVEKPGLPGSVLSGNQHACALASAAAIDPIELLERCMVLLGREEIETDRARL